MKKINSRFGLMVLGMAVLVASCAKVPTYSGSIPMGPVGAVANAALPKSPVEVAAKPALPKSPKDGGRQSLTLRAKVTSGAYRALALPEAYTRSSINHLVVKLFSYMGGVETPVLDSQGEQVQADVLAADLDAPLTFTNLKANTTYRVRAYAYKAAGLASNDLISVDSTSYVDVSVGNDEQPTMGTLRVKLMDVVSDGATSNTSVEITDGTVIHSGTEHIVVGSSAPTPTPTPAPTSTPVSSDVSLVPVMSWTYVGMSGMPSRRSYEATAGGKTYRIKADDNAMGPATSLFDEDDMTGWLTDSQFGDFSVLIEMPDSVAVSSFTTRTDFDGPDQFKLEASATGEFAGEQVTAFSSTSFDAGADATVTTTLNTPTASVRFFKLTIGKNSGMTMANLSLKTFSLNGH